MTKIHPKKRYSQSSTRAAFHSDEIDRMALNFGFEKNSFSATHLSGGFMNANYLVKDSQKTAVIRKVANGREMAQKEEGILKLVRSHQVLAPECLDLAIIDGTSYALHEYVPGVTLEDFLLESGHAGKDLFVDLGRQLARTHSITFDSDGFLGADLQISQPIRDGNQFVVDFMKRVLHGLSPSKLSTELNHRLLKLINKEWDCVRDSSLIGRLTHFDFNPKNILVSSQGELMAVIDWEFAMPANGLADLGNFFRFPYDYPAHAKEAFVSGYREVDPLLPKDWERASRLLDLASMCGFLERKEDYPETFRTARTVIHQTLEHFGY